MKIIGMPGKRTLVRPPEEVITKGGIILPGQVTGESALEGTIVAVGPDCEDKRTVVGAKIVFAPYSKYVLPVNEGPYKGNLIVNEEEILAYWINKEEGEPNNA